MTDPSYTSTIHPPPTPPKRKGWRIRHIAAAYGIGGLILGSALSAAAIQPERIEVQVPGPERVVEKEVEVEVEVPVTPTACITALELNEEAFGYMSESLGHVLDGDYAAASKSTDRITPLVSKVNTAKSECRAAQ